MWELGGHCTSDGFYMHHVKPHAISVHGSISPNELRIRALQCRAGRTDDWVTSDPYPWNTHIPSFAFEKLYTENISLSLWFKETLNAQSNNTF